MDLLGKMETFVRVVEAGSLSSAAKQLRVSTAAVSRHVSALEAELGTPLVARTTRRMSVTSAGQLYYERCLRVLREVRDAQSVGRDSLGGPLRVSLPVTMGLHAGSALLRPLLRQNPALELDVRFEDRLIDLVLEHVDVAVRVAAKPPLSTDIVALPLSRWSRVVVAAPSYLRQHAEPKTPGALAPHEALSSSRDGSSATWTLVSGPATTRVPMKARCTSNSGHLLRQLAIDGLGVALLPGWFVSEDVRARRLKRLLPSWESEPVVIHALYRSSRRNDTRVRLLVEHLKIAYSQIERPDVVR